jgi:cobalt-zinc-cadmium efflux system membrane fusion protein
MSVTVLFFSGCSKAPHDKTETKEHGEEGKHSEEKEGRESSDVKLSGEQLKLASIKDIPASIGDVDVEIQLTGEVSLNLDHTAHIEPSVPGKVRSVSGNLGDTVSSGETIAVIESSELGTAKASYLEKRQQLELARTDYARVKKIHDNTERMLDLLSAAKSIESLDSIKNLDMGEYRSALVTSFSEMTFAHSIYQREKELHGKAISSKGDLLDAENAFRKAEAEYKAAVDQVSFSIKRDLLEKKRAMELAELTLEAMERDLHLLGLGSGEIHKLTNGEKSHGSLAYYTVQAPFDGTVIEKHIAKGELVTEDSEIFLISNLNTVWIIASVYEKDIPRISKGQNATVKVKSYPDKSFEGKVAWISDKIDEETRTLKVRIEVDNKSRLLKPGMFAEIGLGVEKKRGVLVIPASALQSQKGKTIVFIREDKTTFESRQVTTGARSMSEVEITSGLKEGDRVVVEGGFLLKSESEKAGFEEGHSGH